jgi:8-oxo-dGTP pyrophosphatase MutT (NUDIX family)
METTRHHTATVYVVCDGAVALHEHPGLGIRIPPGGHVERDELPHESGLREVREEIGLEPTLIDDTEDVPAPAGEALPTPRHTMLYDINIHEDGSVGHQHIDHVFFARVPSREIDPEDGEEPAEVWDWYTPEELRANDVDPDTTQISIEAIETVRDERE